MVLAGRIAAVACVALLAGEAVAGPVVDDAAKAEALVTEKRPVEALAAIEAAFNLIWDAAPLGFSEALFVAGKPAGFGIYEARPTAIFAPGESMLVYAEPFGYGYGRLDDSFQIGFDADFDLRTPKGQILASKQAFARLEMTSRRRNKEFQVFITYDFAGLRPGDYILATRLRDRHSDKTGQFELPFTIAAPAPETPAPSAPTTPDTPAAAEPSPAPDAPKP